MSELNTYNINNGTPPPYSTPSMKGDGDINLVEAHTSTNMKVKRPKVTQNDLKITLPAKKAFSDKEATKRMQAINTDIYEGAAKEKEKHVFNFKRFFTIFGIIGLLTAALTYFSKGKGK